MARAPEPAVLTTLDTLFVDVPIVAVDADRQPVDLAGLPVRLAFVAKGTQPGAGDWHAATWNTAATAAGLLIGPDAGITYPPGRYVAWWTVDGPNGETPARPAPGPGAEPLLIIQET